MTNRQEILDLLAKGKINADEAADLLSDIKVEAPAPPEAPEPIAVKAAPEVVVKGKKPAWFHVRVSDLETGKSKVNVNIPLRMLNFGLKVGRRFSPELDGFDYDELTGLMNEMGGGMLVEVEDQESNEHVQVFVD
jgi:hypothetical protein